LIVLGYIAYRYFKHKKIDEVDIFLILLILAGWFATFMAHSRSTFIWKNIDIISMLQFPWRFLAVPTFAFSFSAGALVIIASKFKRVLPYFVELLIIGLVAWNWNFFKVERFGPVTDMEKLSGEAWRLQQTAGIYDYLPNTAEMAPQAQRKYLAEVMLGEASIGNEKEGTNWASFSINVASESSEVRVGILKFPTWKAYIDGKEVEVYVPETELWGRLYINVPNGGHEVNLKLVNTPVRTISNIVSLMTIILLLAYLLIHKLYPQRVIKLH